MAFEDLAKHEKNWSSDGNTLQAAARDNFPGPTILTRVRGEKVFNWEKATWPPGCCRRLRQCCALHGEQLVTLIHH